MIHVGDVVLEWFNIVYIVRLILIELADLFLHSVSFWDQILDNQIHIIIGSFEMNDLTVHVCYLLSHFGNLFFSWPNISFQLLYFIIKHKLEFLKFLSLLLELIYSCHFVSDCLLSFFYLFCLRLLSLQILFVFLLDLFNVLQSMLKLMFLFL